MRRTVAILVWAFVFGGMGAAGAAYAATTEEIQKFQEEERARKTELEPKLQKRERENRLKQAEAVRKFHEERIALNASPDAVSNIDEFQRRLADIAKKERDAIKPFEEEKQKIRQERENYRVEFIRKINALNQR